MRKIKFGVIGCGSVSSTYLYTLARNANVDLSFVVDFDFPKAVQRSDEFAIKRRFRDYRQALNEVPVDAAVVCTPHYLHPEQAIYCAEKNIDVLCEKPLATNLSDTEKMIDSCRLINLGTMLQRRFYQNSIATRQAIAEQRLGEIQEVSLEFRCNKSPAFYQNWRGKKISGGGVLISQALHRIDQLVYFFGKPLEVNGKTETTRDYIEVEDFAKGQITFANGIKANIEANNSDVSAGDKTISLITIMGAKGKIVLSDDKTLVWDISDIAKPAEENIDAIPFPFRPAYYGPCHEKVIDDFVESLLRHRRPKITGADSLDAMKIIFGFYESAKNRGAKIKLR